MSIIEVGYGNVDKISIGGKLPLVFIGGPCAIESRDHTIMMAEKIKLICEKVGINFIFKACYDKDCRSSSQSFHGVGIEEGLDIRKYFNLTKKELSKNKIEKLISEKLIRVEGQTLKTTRSGKLLNNYIIREFLC